MAEEERTPMEMASYIINATDSSTVALRAAARMYQDGPDDETGALLQLMYEQSAEQDDHHRIRRDQYETPNPQ
ncbi:MAG: hypothetical protein ACOY94_02930 [Bacillota bacterium]